MAAPIMSNLDLSIIIPAFNEEPNIAPLYKAIMDVAELSDMSFEILVVDDGSGGTYIAHGTVTRIKNRGIG